MCASPYTVMLGIRLGGIHLLRHMEHTWLAYIIHQFHTKCNIIACSDLNIEKYDYIDIIPNDVHLFIASPKYAALYIKYVQFTWCYALFERVNEKN